MSFVICLPWPDKSLSPNARVHWAKKSKAVKASRGGAAIAVLASGVVTSQRAMSELIVRGVEINYRFDPPDARRRDLDNLIASTKAYTDGIADALGMDDSTFSLHYGMGDMPIKGGRVVATIGPKVKR